MKKLFLATTAFVVLAAASAGAADMTARPAYAAPPPVYNWTGVYWGANVGYGWGNARTNINSNATELGVAESTQISQSQKIDGVIGGVQAGYNYQFGTWVWGWETDFQGSGQKGGSTFNTTLVAPVPIPLTATTDHKLEWFGTARGRLGFLWGPNVLLYGTAGVAYGQVKDSATLNGSILGGAVTTSIVHNFNDVKAGWTAGAGIEVPWATAGARSSNISISTSARRSRRLAPPWPPPALARSSPQTTARASGTPTTSSASV